MRSFTACTLCLAVAMGASCHAESPDATATKPVAASVDWSAATQGIVKERPSEGPAVEVAGGFMVPYTERIPGSDVTFEMIPVPGGTYKMGSPESDPEHRDDEGPQVKVTVAPFWIAKTEVTWAEYDEYMNLYSIFKEFEATGTRPVDPGDLTDVITAPTELYEPTHTYEFGKEPEKPAITMTQYAAKQYSKWMSAVTSAQYRLPTEAEWEYACRGGTDTAYSFGDDAEELEAYAWFDYSEDGPSPVAQKKPNPFGLYDMHGNVAEWTVDAYTEDGYANLDPAGLNGINAAQWPKTPFPCTLRGGSWEGEAPDLRSAARLGSHDVDWKEEDPNFPKSPWWFTTDPARGVGFRLVRSYEPVKADTLSKFWESITPKEISDIQSRIRGGRGGYGRADKDLPKAIQDWKDAQ